MSQRDAVPVLTTIMECARARNVCAVVEGCE